MKNNQLISHYGKWLDAQNIPYDSDNGYTPEQEKRILYSF